MDNFTLEELNAMVVDAGESQVIVEATWVDINASGEGVYYATDTDGDAGHVYVTDRGAEGFTINVASLVTAADVVTEYPPAEGYEE